MDTRLLFPSAEGGATGEANQREDSRVMGMGSGEKALPPTSPWVEMNFEWAGMFWGREGLIFWPLAAACFVVPV